MSPALPSARASFLRPALLTLLAIWFGVTLAVWWTATNAFRVASLRDEPALAERFAPLPAPERERALRHLAGEMNRRLFRTWNGAQLLLGCLVLGLSGWGRRRGRAAGGAGLLLLAGALLLIVALHAFWFAPQIETLGRALDFADRQKEAGLAGRFGFYHGAYVVTDLAKAAGLVAAWWLALRGGAGGE